MEKLKEKILKLLKESQKSLKELNHLLSAPRKTVRRALQQLVKEGKVEFTGRKYRLKTKKIVTGTLQLTRSGVGFVLIPEENYEVFIPPRFIKGARNGDFVEVEILRFRKNKPEGKIIRILERRQKRCVGEVISPKKFRPYSPFIPEQKIIKGEAKAGEIWLAKLEAKGVKLVENLTGKSESEIDFKTVVEELGLAVEFPKEALEEAWKVAVEPTEKDFKNREDLRRLFTVTIDGEDAKDFDDAVSVKKEKEGWRLWVHIADVSHYVKEGSALDAEARKRGTSVYLIDRVIPMLPPQLSNGICSLQEGKNRLTITVEMLISHDGRLKDYLIYPSIIKVDRRLTYSYVQEVLDKKTAETDLEKVLFCMKELAEVLYEKSLQRGKLEFELPEIKVLLDEKGRVEKLIKRKRLFSELIIEEFMIMANRTVAEHLSWASWPSIYRIHDRPKKRKLIQLAKALKEAGFKESRVKRLFKLKSPKVLQQILEEVKNMTGGEVLHELILKSMEQAQYAPDNIGHFGLSLEFYTHFTSPIRRYPDLIVHRMLKELLAGKEISPEKEEQLRQIALHCSVRERIADEAERILKDIKGVRYFSNKIGCEVEVQVSNVIKNTVFVQTVNEGVTGVLKNYKGKPVLGSRFKAKVCGSSLFDRLVFFCLS